MHPFILVTASNNASPANISICLRFAGVTLRATFRGGRTAGFCAEDADSVVRCNRQAVGAWERYTPEIVAQFTKFAYRGGRTNRYCADDNDSVVRCNRNARAAWETFTVTILQGTVNRGGPRAGDNFVVSLTGGRGNRFCSDDNDNVVRCNRASVQQWERFTLAFV
jgi:hypothetical protein